MNELSDEEIKRLRKLLDSEETLEKVVEREEAVTWLWGYIRSLFILATGVTALYGLFELLRGIRT